MFDSKLSPKELSLAMSISHKVKSLIDAGMSLESVVEEVRAHTAELGIGVSISIEEINGVRGLHIRRVPELDRRITQPDCPGPHVSCPVCRDPEALCLNPALLAAVGVKSTDEFPPNGTCYKCGSFLVLQKIDGTPSFRPMTADEVLELTDDERIRMLARRREALARQARDAGATVQ